MNKLFPLRIGPTLPDEFRNDLQVELEAIPRLNREIELCQRLGDDGTRDLLQKFLVDEEHHVDWLDTQLQIIEEAGAANYLPQQINGEGH